MARYVFAIFAYACAMTASCQFQGAISDNQYQAKKYAEKMTLLSTYLHKLDQREFDSISTIDDIIQIHRKNGNASKFIDIDDIIEMNSGDYILFKKDGKLTIYSEKYPKLFVQVSTATVKKSYYFSKGNICYYE